MESQTNEDRKLLVITTKGCESCTILKKQIDSALELTHKKIEVEYKDVSECDKLWLKQNRITDFPTMFFIKNSTIRYKYKGTAPAIVIARWIDVQLK